MRRRTGRGFCCWRPMRRRMLTNLSRCVRVVSALGPGGTCAITVSWPVSDQPGLCPTLWRRMILSAGSSRDVRRNDLPPGLVQARADWLLRWPDRIQSAAGSTQLAYLDLFGLRSVINAPGARPGKGHGIEFVQESGDRCSVAQMHVPAWRNPTVAEGDSVRAVELNLSFSRYQRRRYSENRCANRRLVWPGSQKTVKGRASTNAGVVEIANLLTER